MYAVINRVIDKLDHQVITHEKKVVGLYQDEGGLNSYANM
jgi:ribosome-associated translation inhibitor RaiA